MAISYVGASVGAPGAHDTTTMSVTQHASTLVGDLLLLAVGVSSVSGNPVISPTPTGWTLYKTLGPSESSHLVKIFHREAATVGAASHTVDFTDDGPAADATWVMMAFRGHQPLAGGLTFSGEGGSGDTTDSSTNDRICGSGVPAAGTPMEMAVAFFSVKGTTGGAYTYTPPSGWTGTAVAYATDSPVMAGAYKVTSTAPGAANATFDKGSAWNVQNNLGEQILLAVGRTVRYQMVI